ncbi:PIN domain-containing protein [Pandoraea sputorum]|uniref:type II toxin-antitoxin system VapC family toxin n=1 Tax=Pandoraea sputorum TaxID=93222 RepID=UPI001242A387|nr:type II toxin-antitoxin system VapC family toxin [Pandoraea sputorum]
MRLRLDADYGELWIDAQHAFEVSLLPLIHKDPYHRILVAWSIAEGTVPLTRAALSHSWVASVGYV